MITIDRLTVTFGGVRPLDDVTVAFEAPVCGLIGPNGAGKTTLFNVMSGFVRPRAGSIQADGRDLLAMTPRHRARWGLRRTFQQDQVIESLSVRDNLLVAHEHSGHSTGDAPVDVLAEVGVEVNPDGPASALSVRERRLLELARALVGQPRIVLIDEPGAGLDEDETAELAEVIARLPTRFGVQVLLVDHDMTLVQASCETIAVLDFGRLIASGPCREVLSDDGVRRAYLGVEELAAC
jgi:branched-chain amino acid transport system ATP-binding protein